MNIKKLIKRTQQRISMAAGAWNASSRTKSTIRWLMSPPGDADQNNQYELPELRLKSGELVRNFPIATAILNRKRHTIVGSGIRLQPMIDYEYLGIPKDEAEKINLKILSEFRLWADPLGTCDIERQVNFSGYQRLLLDSRLERGDVFTVFVGKRRAGCPFHLRLQMVEADQISNPKGMPDTAYMHDGIERDISGEITAIHYQYRHPGNMTNAFEREWKRIPIFSNTGERQVLQFIDKRRRGQSRGVPDLTPVIESLAQLTKFSEAYLHKALVNAFFTFFYKGSDLNSPLDGIGVNSGEGVSSRQEDPLRKLDIGTALELGEDEDIVQVESKTPNSEYKPYRDAIIQEIGMAVNVPPEIMMTLFSTSYTAAQAAFMEYWRYVETERDLIYAQLNEIYTAWFDDAIRLGRLQLPKYRTGDYAVRAAYTRCAWVAPSKGHLRPEALNKADAVAEDRGWKTPEQNAQERGNDYTPPYNKNLDNTTQREVR